MLADAIVSAWQKHKEIPPLEIGPFEDIPNQFTLGEWHEAANESGWLPGPDIANFIFATGTKDQLPKPPGRYGEAASGWRPYLPESQKTVAEIAKEITHKKALRYREIVIDKRLPGELAGAKDRKNLTVVVTANPRALSFEPYSWVAAFDGVSWEGTSLLVPWDGIEGQWEDRTIRDPLATTFPIVSQLSQPAFHAPIPSIDALQTSIDVTLTELRARLTKKAIELKPKTDAPPASVTSTSAQ